MKVSSFVDNEAWENEQCTDCLCILCVYMYLHGDWIGSYLKIR